MSCPNCGYCYACGRPYGYGYQRPYITWTSGQSTLEKDLKDFYQKNVTNATSGNISPAEPQGLKKGCSHS